MIIRVEAPDGAVRNVVATGPIPMDWPEQRVRLISQKISSQGKCSETVFKGQAALLKFQVPTIPKGGSALSNAFTKSRGFGLASRSRAKN